MNGIDNGNAPTLQLMAKLCFDKFRSLPKTGKPTADQWTVLAGVVQHDKEDGMSKVVALGCGTKCIGRSLLCPNGLILNDSHAEVLARRAFMRYLYHELEKATEKEKPHTTIFKWEPTIKCFVMNDNIEFHFLSTQVPCGDACIREHHEIAEKRPRLDESCDDEVFTGAKLLKRDEHSTDDMEQTPGAIRYKPGRGERTLSLSCSDKISRWNVLGVQGALLDLLIASPIYFTTLNFYCNDANLDSLKRAIYERWDCTRFNHPRYKVKEPIIRTGTTDASLEFEYRQRGDCQPAPNGLVWCELPQQLKPYEISVNGKRQGVTKKKLKTPSAALAISKYRFLHAFLDIFRASPVLLEKFAPESKMLDTLTYADCKNLSQDYQMAWQQLKQDYFQQWTLKSNDLMNFSINSK